MIACYLAGADIVDVATDAMSGVTSQPSMGAVLNSLPTPNSQFDQDRLFEINNYWEQASFNSDLKLYQSCRNRTMNYFIIHRMTDKY